MKNKLEILLYEQKLSILVNQLRKSVIRERQSFISSCFKTFCKAKDKFM